MERKIEAFFKKWQKPCVEALKCSEIECLGFTERERDLCLAYFSSFFPLKLGCSHTNTIT